LSTGRHFVDHYFLADWDPWRMAHLPTIRQQEGHLDLDPDPDPGHLHDPFLERY
jgi:hypothetical protein